MLLRTEAACQQKMVASFDLARSAGLKDQALKIEQTIRGLYHR